MADELTGKELDAAAKRLDVQLSEDGNRKSADQLRAEVAAAQKRLDETGTTDTAANLDPPDPAPANVEESFSVATLIQTPLYLGRQFNAGDVAGAFHGVDPETTYTLDAARAHIVAWLAAPTETDSEVQH